MTVRLELREGAAVISIDNAPVNVLGASVRAGLMQALDRAEAAGVWRVVLTGSGTSFSAGADAREFGAAPKPPHLPDILRRIEGFAVPCVAAINGTALGGGLELALACRWRVAAPGVRLGLPEVTLGIVPGAGGTQRLPRLIGVAAALDLVSSGRAIEAAEAERLGLVEGLSDDPVAAALALDRRQVEAVLAPGERERPAPDPAAVEAARRNAARRMASQDAPQRGIDLVEASTRLTLEQGLAAEREAFLALRGSAQARALRHVFFAERAAQGLLRRIAAEPTEITRAVVVGGGTMGAGIAYALAGIGVGATVVEADPQGAARARANVARLYDEAVRRGRMSAEAAAADMAQKLSFAVGYDSLPPAEIAIEAAFEDLPVKRAVFAALDAALPPSAVLATNTSFLDVNRIAEDVSRPERTLSLHFFSPAHIMKLLEVVRGAHTSESTLATALRLARRLGKIPVLAGICDGFIGNRILTRYRQATDVIMLEGALPGQIDAAMRGFGFAMGPYEVQDLAGLDISYANRKRLRLSEQPGIRYVPIADRMVEELGRLGRKTGAGWYDYEEGAGAKPSPATEALILDTAERQGVERRAFEAGEIVERAIAAMVEEACRILEEGIAARPADIDLVMIHGYAFPRWRGGLMHHADTVGPAALLRHIETLREADGRSCSPPDLLCRLAREGGTFDSLNSAQGGGAA
ncbi:3-hydroxyacyl-CoA dehydrogenase NAD-binding domain-containing protein [Afifella pfennigii]|uniref:3-hydroxyacyl-CoA dehydrogenase NAD-binding domain-containing protein n=1 Tax=Afifella pfennigii TaxID=209897 RepID=UPI000550F865|nr:3-hydroxyacyl-CoA dehydrogenase NAD-binding domain-containing protein [Afifella pfennigii]